MSYRLYLPLTVLSLVLITPERSNAFVQDEGQDEKKPVTLKGSEFSGLKARSIGPALMSGRIGDFAVNPDKPSEYYVAVSSGSVWKTTNGGVTYKPIFENYGSYSIGCITMDPNNTNVLWVGSGENNSQRSVSFGDGVYKSIDGGNSWKNLGLKESEHIGMITVDPRDSNVVFVAAQGPLWRSGGDRGLYKTTDGGASWRRVLHISEHTGVNEVHMDPRNPDVMYASAYQRQRHVWTLVNGGPESAIYKSTDGGENWRKITRGLPGADKGRIGMDISPANPDVVYAIIEAADDQGGFFRSTDRGETWKKRSDYMSGSPQYYNELVCDPYNVDRVYSLSTLINITEDGGRTFGNVPRRGKHVDNHAMWIDPDDTDHLLVGCDGGIYETWDRGEAWEFKPNLPITQYYKACVDNSMPFYYVYGGTQDNNTQGGPAQTINPAGIPNEEWFITVGGDGFQPRVDPENPNIVYSEWQHGGLMRYDRESGQQVDIKPREAPGDEPEVWNWDSPLIISPHNHKRLYFAGRRLYQSDDRGDSWTRISGDLYRGLDRNTMKVMDKIQKFGAVSLHRSTSIYGNAVSMTESPLVEGLIYVGSDDGLINITEDNGENWRQVGLFPGVPDLSYVSYLTASEHDPDTIFACFENHKMGDFKPYLLKSVDRGRNWTSIAGDLPERNYLHAVQQDHVNPELLFVGTEFGASYTVDGGTHWHKIAGLPTIAVMDLHLQRRENDVVMATFGRSFYVLDDYTPLRVVDNETLKKDAHIFPIQEGLMYIQTSRLGGGGRGSLGASYYTGDNPAYGVNFTYHLKDSIKTERQKREDKDKGETFPSVEDLQAKADEFAPSMHLVIRDSEGEVVRRLSGSIKAGVHRTTWDFRYPSLRPVTGGGGRRFFFGGGGGGPMATPGIYTVQIVSQVDGEYTELTDQVEFRTKMYELGTITTEDKEAALAFNRKVADLQRAVLGTSRVIGEVSARLTAMRTALGRTSAAELSMLKEIHDLELELTAISRKMNGEREYGRLFEPGPTSISQRISAITSGWYLTSPPTGTQREQYGYASEEFGTLLEDLRSFVNDRLKPMEDRLEELGAPWTPGRIPNWNKQ